MTPPSDKYESSHRHSPGEVKKVAPARLSLGAPLFFRFVLSFSASDRNGARPPCTGMDATSSRDARLDGSVDTHAGPGDSRRSWDYRRAPDSCLAAARPRHV